MFDRFFMWQLLFYFNYRSCNINIYDLIDYTNPVLDHAVIYYYFI